MGRSLVSIRASLSSALLDRRRLAGFQAHPFKMPGSANETKSHLLYARDVHYIENQTYESLGHRLEGVLFDLNSIVNALRRNLKS